MSILCEQVLGTLHDAQFTGCPVDIVELQWDEAFKKMHRKTSRGGREIGIRLGDWVLREGLHEGDVLYQDEQGVVAVAYAPAKVLRVTIAPGHTRSLAKACYEIGNRHAPLFWGKRENELLTPYNAPMQLLLEGIHGVSTEVAEAVLDIDARISAAVHSHTH